MLSTRAERAIAGLAALVLLVIAAYRAAHGTSDLVTGYLIPTRGLLFEGKDLARDYPFNSFTPFFYCVMAPLALLPDVAASVSWSLLQLAQLFFCARWLTALGASPRATAIAYAAGAFLIGNNLVLGQSNTFALFFVIAAVHALWRKRDAPAGALLSVAIAFKLTSGLLLPWLLLTRRWKAAGAAAVGLIVWLLVVPSAVLGPARNLEQLRGWHERVLSRYLTGEKVQTSNIRWYHTNQSLEAFVQRHFTSYGRDEYGGLHTTLDPAWLTQTQAAKVAWAARLLVLAALVALTLRGRATLLTEAGLWLMGALLLSPASWISHYLSLLVLFTAAALERRHWPWLALASLGSWLCLGPGVESFSPLFLATLPLFVRLAYCSMKNRPAARHRSSSARLDLTY